MCFVGRGGEGARVAAGHNVTTQYLFFPRLWMSQLDKSPVGTRIRLVLSICGVARIPRLAHIHTRLHTHPPLLNPSTNFIF